MAEQSPGSIPDTRRISTAPLTPIATGEPRKHRTPARLLRLPIFELAPTNRQGLTGRHAALSSPNGGRTWWAHFEFTRINIELTILSKKFKDLREAGASKSIRRAPPH